MTTTKTSGWTGARLRAVWAALGLCAAACGGDESDYETQTNPQFASLAVSQLVGIGGAVAAGNPDGASAGVLQLGNLAQNIITPVLAHQERRAAPGPVPLVGTCTCDTGGCRFEGCGADDGSWTIDGSISMDGEAFTFDVSMTQHFASDSTSTDNDLNLSGDMTIGTAVVDGQVSGEIDAEISDIDEDGTTTISTWFDWSIDAAQIGLDVSRCAVSGSMDAAVSAEAASGGRDADYNGTGTVSFGPSCGDAVVAP
jgi:hypothetical protein